jgi:SynChlorMet cassette protein ScmC
VSRDCKNRSFILKLDDRCAWNLTGTRGTEQWFAQFASVLKLREGNSAELPTITFLRGGPAGPSGSDPPWPPDAAELNILEEEGWQPHHLGLVRYWSPPSGRDLVCELLNSRVRETAVLMMGQALQPLYLEAMRFGGLPLHGALVALDGHGVVLAGPNDAGKTTCCRRLPSPWKVLGDDETLVIHSDGKGYFAHPLPTWSNHLRSRSDHSCDVEQRVSLAAVFFLQQAPYVEALPMGEGRAAIEINESARQTHAWRLRGLCPGEENEWSTRVFENACHITRQVPAYTLRLNLGGRFWKEVERLLFPMRH